MKAKLNLSLLLFLFFSTHLYGQYEFYQYFDGADTVDNSIVIEYDTSSNNIWQVGMPQKNIFNSAATLPNALVTDTINFIPTNDTSSFQYNITPWNTWGILAIQWKQKLDMDSVLDFGIIEFSVDSGSTWQNAFGNPYVYNFYGYDQSNVDTMPNGEMAFTGTDTTWRDIWLCYDITWLNFNDNVMVRHTMLSDSVDNQNEGWLIDNLLAHVTIIHTVAEVEQEEYIKAYPNPTTGRLDISLKKINGPHIIEKMELLDASGRRINQWENIPTKYFIDMAGLQNGVYYLRLKTNLSKEVVKVVLQK